MICMLYSEKADEFQWKIDMNNDNLFSGFEKMFSLKVEQTQPKDKYLHS